MLQYLIILLDDTSTSFCHYEVSFRSQDGIGTLMPLDVLRKGIRFAMMENLNIQFVYPEREVPDEWKEVIETIDHTKIKPAPLAFTPCESDEMELDMADVAVINDWQIPTESVECPLVIRTGKIDFFNRYSDLFPQFHCCPRINLVLTDVESFTEEDFVRYKNVLSVISDELERLYVEGHNPQLNLLTDRMMLKEMNNCGAGESSVTLAPNGKFYVCPAFYYEDAEDSIGDIEEGLDIKNRQLYKLDYAPICRHCDSYQCKRCAWLSRKLTLEVNTPSRQQCAMAHLERNASRDLLQKIRKHGTFMPEINISEIDYLDPFEERENWLN